MACWLTRNNIGVPVTMWTWTMSARPEDYGFVRPSDMHWCDSSNPQLTGTGRHGALAPRYLANAARSMFIEFLLFDPFF